MADSGPMYIDIKLTEDTINVLDYVRTVQREAGMIPPEVKPITGPSNVGDIDKPPAHYAADGMQPFDVIEAFDLDFFEGNALKYLLRHKKKNGKEDLLKAKHYIDEVIARQYADA